jgi:hypothetical protein
MVLRLNNFTAYNNASSGVGAGGHSIDLGFWYQVKWADVSTSFAEWVLKTLNNGLVTDAHINWPEYIATGLCLAGAVVMYDYRVQNGQMTKLVGLRYITLTGTTTRGTRQPPKAQQQPAAKWREP